MKYWLYVVSFLLIAVIVSQHYEAVETVQQHKEEIKALSTSLTRYELEKVELTTQHDYYRNLINELETELNKKQAEIEQLKEEQAYKRDIPLSDELQKFLYDLAKEYNVSYDLALAVMKTESNFDATAVNHNTNGTKDIGLFQINEVNHKWLREELGALDFYNAKDSIKAGVFMLSRLKDKYTSENAVLIAYNMGEGGMKRLASKGVYTTKYTEKVKKHKQEIKGANI